MGRSKKKPLQSFESLSSPVESEEVSAAMPQTLLSFWPIRLANEFYNVRVVAN